MFKEHKRHFQTDLFTTEVAMNPKLQDKLNNSWASVYYEHVFCKIDESGFAPLYCKDNGRPNFPVNVLLSLEFIKHMKNYSDEELLEQYYFNYQISYAVGLRTLGELYLAPRTLYDFRRRIYDYLKDNPQNDIIFNQFQSLTGYFIEKANLDTSEQRMDSTGIMSNIRQAGRLSLAVDVLLQAVKMLPEKKLSDNLKRVLEPNFTNKVIYHTRSNDTQTKLKEIISLMTEALIIAGNCKLDKKQPFQITERFINEQTTDGKNKTKIIKNGDDISADSLQSAYDSDATYRKKGKKEWSGYVANLAETCAEENKAQLITDYSVEKNIVSDVEMAKQRIPKIKEKTNAKNIYLDGGYYDTDLKQSIERDGTKLHYTDMTGRKEDGSKIPISKFVFTEDLKSIKACPAGYKPNRVYYKEKGNIISAYFDKEKCKTCPFKEQCRVKIQKKESVLRISQKSVVISQTRMQIQNKEERAKKVSKRAGIEGTNSALKRKEGAGKLNVRGIVKTRIVFGYKVIARNINQFYAIIGEITKEPLVFKGQGGSLPNLVPQG